MLALASSGVHHYLLFVDTVPRAGVGTAPKAGRRFACINMTVRLAQTDVMMLLVLCRVKLVFPEV